MRIKVQDYGDLGIKRQVEWILSVGLMKYVSSPRRLPQFRIGQLWGFIDQKGNMVIQPKFDRVEDLVDGRFWVKNSHGSFLIVRKEKIFVSLIYGDVGEFNEGLCWVRKGGKWGFIDKTGKVVIPINSTYDYVWSFSEGLSGVRKGGFIDKTGKEVIPLIYDDVRDFSEGLCKVEKDDKWGFINKKGVSPYPPPEF